ncbi:hypothetical protein ACWIGM_11665 [Bosea sp. NPDC055332]
MAASRGRIDPKGERLKVESIIDFVRKLEASGRTDEFVTFWRERRLTLRANAKTLRSLSMFLETLAEPQMQSMATRTLESNRAQCVDYQCPHVER